MSHFENISCMCRSTLFSGANDLCVQNVLKIANAIIFVIKLLAIYDMLTAYIH